MKKTLGIVALAVCAMTITSCGAPSISIEDAKEGTILFSGDRQAGNERCH